jgi:hypothetical protein
MRIYATKPNEQGEEVNCSFKVKDENDNIQEVTTYETPLNIPNLYQFIFNMANLNDTCTLHVMEDEVDGERRIFSLHTR